MNETLDMQQEYAKFSSSLKTNKNHPFNNLKKEKKKGYNIMMVNTCFGDCFRSASVNSSFCLTV